MTSATQQSIADDDKHGDNFGLVWSALWSWWVNSEIFSFFCYKHIGAKEKCKLMQKRSNMMIRAVCLKFRLTALMMTIAWNIMLIFMIYDDTFDTLQYMTIHDDTFKFLFSCFCCRVINTVTEPLWSLCIWWYDERHLWWLHTCTLYTVNSQVSLFLLLLRSHKHCYQTSLWRILPSEFKAAWIFSYHHHPQICCT